jgi:hypothetical protein
MGGQAVRRIGVDGQQRESPAQPRSSQPSATGASGQGLPGRVRAGMAGMIGPVQRRSVIGAGHRQAARIHHRPGKGQMLGQRQHRVAEQLRHRRFGRDEIGRAGGVQDVLIRAMTRSAS